MNMNVTVLVLAAGKGVRFASSGGHTHKLQALLAGKPVMSHVLEAVAKAGLQCHVVSPAGAETEGMVTPLPAVCVLRRVRRVG